MLSPRSTILIFVLETLWLLALTWSLVSALKSARLLRVRRWRRALIYVGLGFCILPVASLWILTLGWLLPDFSQRLAGFSYYLLVAIIFWSAPVALIAGLCGIGFRRTLTIGTSLLVGAFWVSISMTDAISMGPSLARHAVEYLIPNGYVGWATVWYGDSPAPPLPIVKGQIICKFPAGVVLHTSSRLEDGWAKDKYFYYAPDGSWHELKDTGWGAGGMIWGGYVSYETGPGGTPSAYKEAFFVGTEAQYKQGADRTP